MPTLSMFYGIIIRMYFFDDKQHHMPHIHVEYADSKAVINFFWTAIFWLVSCPRVRPS
jgi:hypothetical protein